MFTFNFNLIIMRTTQCLNKDNIKQKYNDLSEVFNDNLSRVFQYCTVAAL